jgi:glycosyltransferase involved in cell wall biosynthesis
MLLYIKQNNFMNKKIAIFHNFMDNIGGAEMVTLFLARGLNADIYTTNIDTEQIKKMGFEDIIHKITSLGKIPKMAPFRHQLALWKFRKLNLGKKYDFYIISGDWAMSGAVNNKPNLWYVHSPLNELWAFKDYVRENVLTWWKKPIFDIWVWFNRKITLINSKHVNIWVCNSNNTKNRIKKYYNKEAMVINPPVDTTKHLYKNSENFWLSVNRITKHKRIEIQMKAFSKLPNEKLIIVGSYEKGAKQFEDYKKYIESIKPSNVEIISWVDSEKLISLYNTCKGFITTARDEDFGMTPVEAMASGKPIIAPNEGGYKETVIDGVTGILIDNIDENKLITAINLITDNLKKDASFYKEKNQKRSNDFDINIFIDKIKIEIKKYEEKI